jgi:predicted nucleic acid-binding Zn ribbon protein
MRAFKDLVVKNGVQRSRQQVLDDKTVFFAFERVVTEWYGIKGKENIFPEQWKEGTLFIRVRSSLWLNELLMEKEKLLKAVNTFLGTEQVKILSLKRG